VTGITICRKFEDYRQAVIHAGCEPRELRPGMSIEEALIGVEGLVLTGGEDVDPALYGEEPHPTVTDVNRARDDFEIALIREARRRDLPLLGICRGIQVLNVACGGSLIQDIPSEAPSDIAHQVKTPPHESYALAHEVWLERDSRLERLLRDTLEGSDTCHVNSRHHQAIARVAPGFTVTATAPDGIVEAIEDASARFCVAVQWHPENFWRTGEFRALFEGFLAARHT
jgi:putative glutamine amidotransferase